MEKVSRHSKYLVPLVVGQNKGKAFIILEEKMKDRVTDWKNMVLSLNGKETLIKACLQAMPLYLMSCLKLPKGLCDKLNSLTLSYWWNTGNNQRSINWISNETLQKEKKYGGLGRRCFESLNDALRMKQLWRFIKFLDLLVSRVMKERYFHNGCLLDYKPKGSDSFLWKSIL